MLSNVRIVLIGTSHPGNIGAAARAMKTMNLGRLYLVAPQDYPCAEATARASGADDVLARAQVCADLDEALAGCRFVVGTSARRRSLRWPEFDPRECGERVMAEAAGGEVAILFGRERTGLTNSELERCHALVTIPANPDYSSLNLAAAVQVITYELTMAARTPEAGIPPSAIGDQEAPATADDLNRFYTHLEQVLVETEFLDPDEPKQLMRRLKRLFNRARPDKVEMNILRGILTAVQRSLGRR
jgi:TrmH family RNA methyltransferase